MSLPKHKNPTRENRVATAPYNFIPLPDRVVTVVESADALPDHHRFDVQLRTGYFEVVLTTHAPLYIRGALSNERRDGQPSEFEQVERQKSAKEALPFREDLRNKPDFFSPGGQPMIPGSSLRGMLRSLLEIVSYGKCSRVTDFHKIFFRAVAAEDDNPLKFAYYDRALGKQGKRVNAGFLISRGDNWYIQPALNGMALGLPQQRPFLTFKDEEAEIPGAAVPGRLRLGDNKYRPGYYGIGVTVEPKLDEDGQAEVDQDGNSVLGARIVNRDTVGSHPAMLVCSGDMRETQDKGIGDALAAQDDETNRKKHVVVLEDPSSDPAAAIKINRQAVTDYLDALTPYQKAFPDRDRNGVARGVLSHGRPVFYVLEEGQSEVWYFGHSPNFRIPALIEAKNSQGQVIRRAAVPRDFVPVQLRRAEQIDYADALFGFTRTRQEIDEMKSRDLAEPAPGTKARAYASRVFVSDGKLKQGQTNVLLDVVEPRILASPKPSTFAHYLVQTGLEQEDLWHYASGTPSETVIRGHKFYWPQGNVGVEQIQEQDKRWIGTDGKVKDDSTQHTRIMPIRAGVSFKFRVYFESLRDRELGALCWILHPLGDEAIRQNDASGYCHRLGMGKPLGLGTVKLDATLFLTPRAERYAVLFEGRRWKTASNAKGERLVDRSELVQRLTKEFEDHILDSLKPFNDECQRLANLKRIAILLKMMEWPGFVSELPPTAANRWKTTAGRPNPRYLTIELPGVARRDGNEYKQQPILPDVSDIRFGTVTGLVEPTTTIVEEEPLETAQAVSASTVQVEEVVVPVLEPLSPPPPRLSKRENLPAPVQEPRPQQRESVVLLTNVSKKGNATVRTESGQEVFCKNIRRPYPLLVLSINDRIYAEVIYEGDSAVEATWSPS